MDMTTTTVPLAMIGKSGRATHAIGSSPRGGRVLCELNGPYLTRDHNGGYTDGSLHSDFRPLGHNGHPTCSRCQRELAK
jgi:hypothetical protein